MIETTIAFNKKDIKDFSDVMERFQKVTGKAPKQAVKWGAIKVLSSLGASTKIAKETRKVYLPKTKKEKEFIDKKGRHLFYVQMFTRSGKEKRMPVWAMNKEQVKHFPIAKIHNRKMAKLSWGWAKADLFKGKSLTFKGIRIVRRAVDTKKIETKKRFGVTITNNLDYIEKAFKTKGKMAVGEAMARAVRGMTKQVEKMLFKAAHK